MSQDACTAGLRLESRGLDIGNLGGEGRKTLAPQGLRLESRVWISETAEVSVARRLHCGITFGIQGWISETSEVRVARLLHRRDYVWNPGQTRVCNGLSTGLEVKSRFLSVRLRGGPRVWLARWVLDSPRGWARRDSLSESPFASLDCAGVSGTTSCWIVGI